MKAHYWIDQVKAKKHLHSDYAVAKLLGITQSAVSRLRSHDSTLSDDTAVKVAQLLGVNPAGVLVDQLAERSKSESVKATLSKVAGELCILCKQIPAIVRIARQPTPRHTSGIFAAVFAA